MSAGPVLAGVPCAPGRAAGRAFQLRHQESAQAPARNLDEAVDRLARQLDARRITVSDPDLAQHLEVQRWLLADPMLLGRARELVARGVEARMAARRAVAQASEELRALGDPMMAARVADLADLGERLDDVLSGRRRQAQIPAHPGILLAVDLGPETLLELLGPAQDRWRRPIRAILLQRGAPLSHVSILARARGIPLVGGLAGLLQRVGEGQGLLVDGGRGQVVVDPRREDLRAFRSHRLPARIPTGRGAPVRLLCNLDLPEELPQARAGGADGIGLLRTDALLGPRGGAPPVADQAARYAAALRAWPEAEIVIRTFDAPAPGPDPSLGPRGVRWMGLDARRSTGQLQALVLAARAVPQAQLGILLPMVSRPDELSAVRASLDALWTGGGRPPRLGAMVETPAAALRIEEILDVADFVAVGTNDLLQLLVGASREDPRVAPLLDLEHPALWELLGRVALAARLRSRDAWVCGALASHLEHLPRLLELGFGGVSVGLADLVATRRALSR